MGEYQVVASRLAGSRPRFVWCYPCLSTTMETYVYFFVSSIDLCVLIDTLRLGGLVSFSWLVSPAACQMSSRPVFVATLQASHSY